MPDYPHTTDASGTEASWTPMALGASVAAGDTAPGTRREGSRVWARGQLTWTTTTLAAASTLVTVTAVHRPTVRKTLTVRTGPDSNVVTQLHMNTDGTVTNQSSLGTTTTGMLSLDGMSYDK